MFTAGDEFQTTSLPVATFLGTGTGGREVFADPVNLDCIVEDGRKLVRAANGDQVVSETTLYTNLTNTAAFATDSKVTLPTRTARVILAKPHAIGDPDVDHLEVVLT